MVLVRYGANYTYSVNFKMNPRLTHPTKKSPQREAESKHQGASINFYSGDFSGIGKNLSLFWRITFPFLWQNHKM